MLELFFNRVTGTFVMFVGGLNLIGWGLYTNGAARDRHNPIWPYFAALFNLELGIFYLIFYGGLTVLGAFLLWRLIAYVRAQRARIQEERAQTQREIEYQWLVEKERRSRRESKSETSKSGKISESCG